MNSAQRRIVTRKLSALFGIRAGDNVTISETSKPASVEKIHPNPAKPQILVKYRNGRRGKVHMAGVSLAV